MMIDEKLRFGAYIWLKHKRKRKWAEGIIRAYRLPDGWTDEQYCYWWLPETDGHGKVLRPARLDAQTKQRFLEAEACNQVMNAGRTQILTYVGSSSGNSTAWSQYFAVGTGSITATNPTDTSLVNETFRKQFASYAVTGTTVDINVQFGTTEGVYTYTNAGIFGSNANATLGSGTLMTHALFSYTKGNTYAISIDYVINLL